MLDQHCCWWLVQLQVRFYKERDTFVGIYNLGTCWPDKMRGKVVYGYFPILGDASSCIVFFDKVCVGKICISCYERRFTHEPHPCKISNMLVSKDAASGIRCVRVKMVL
jgi:hypothetical protein